MQYGSDSAGFGRLSASGLPSLNHAPPGNTPPSPLTGWYCWAKPPSLYSLSAGHLAPAVTSGAHDQAGWFLHHKMPSLILK